MLFLLCFWALSWAAQAPSLEQRKWLSICYSPPITRMFMITQELIGLDLEGIDRWYAQQSPDVKPIIEKSLMEAFEFPAEYVSKTMIAKYKQMVRLASRALSPVNFFAILSKLGPGGNVSIGWPSCYAKYLFIEQKALLIDGHNPPAWEGLIHDRSEEILLDLPLLQAVPFDLMKQFLLTLEMNKRSAWMIELPLEELPLSALVGLGQRFPLATLNAALLKAKQTWLRNTNFRINNIYRQAAIRLMRQKPQLFTQGQGLLFLKITFAWMYGYELAMIQHPSPSKRKERLKEIFDDLLAYSESDLAQQLSWQQPLYAELQATQAIPASLSPESLSLLTGLQEKAKESWLEIHVWRCSILMESIFSGAPENQAALNDYKAHVKTQLNQLNQQVLNLTGIQNYYILQKRDVSYLVPLYSAPPLILPTMLKFLALRSQLDNHLISVVLNPFNW